ncbi:hypothetical protein, partial [Parvibium lacunae]
MLTTTQLKEYAQLAQASYAAFTTGYGDDPVMDQLKKPYNEAASFSEIEAKQLTAKYSVVDQFKSSLLDSGFSATVLSDKANPNHLILSFRGTEPKGLQLLNDLIISDVQIGIVGYAKPQALDLYRYIRQLQTVGQQKVVYSEIEMQRMYLLDKGPNILPPTPSGLLFDLITDKVAYSTFKASLQNDRGIGASGAAAILSPGKTIDVTGHSLGGHLAMLAQRLFPDLVTGTAVTYNAVGFYAGPLAFDGSPVQKKADWILDQFGANDFSNNVLRVESEGDGISKIASVYPGQTLSVGMETYPGVADAIGKNHSVANIADGMALVEFIGKLDSRYMADPRLAKDLFKMGSNQPVSSYEKILDGLRNMLSGPITAPTANDSDKKGEYGTSRDSFYTNLQQLAYKDNIGTLNASMAALAGKLQITATTANAESAKSDFGQFLSLYYLTPFTVSTPDAGSQAKLLLTQ